MEAEKLFIYLTALLGTRTIDIRRKGSVRTGHGVPCGALPLINETHPTQPRGGHPSHSNLVRGKLTSPTPNPAGDGTSGLTSYPRRRSKVSEATCLRPQRSAPSGLEPGPSDPESSALTTGPLTPHKV